MNVDKLVFTWNDFTVFSAGDVFTLMYQGKQAAQRTIQVDRPAYSAEWIGDILVQLIDEAVGVPQAAREILVGLTEDLLSQPDLLDWWTCKACGKRTFAAPGDQQVCVWCGTETNADQNIQ